MATSIEINNLSKRYGYAYALKSVTLETIHGEVVGLLGPNGSGKTTLLKVLATLTAPTSGDVKEYGLDLRKNSRAIRRMVGYVPHTPLLYKDLTGEENIRFFSNFYSFSSKGDLQKRLDRTFNLFGITRWRHEPVKTLSSGLWKRFDLARAIIHDPQILLLDEPFTGLDVVSVKTVHDFIRDVRRNKTVILSTHNFNQARQLCDRVVILVEGKIGQQLRGSDISEASVKGIFERGSSI